MKIEATNLEQALMKAAKELECSVIDIEYEVVQYHQSGFLGLFKKNAIIEARSKRKRKFDKKFPKKAFNDRAKYSENYASRSFENKEKTYESKNYEHKNYDTFKENKDLENKTTQSLENEAQTNNLNPPFAKSKYIVRDDAIFNSFHKESGVNPKFCIDEIRIQLENLLKAGSFDIKIVELSVYDKNSIYIRLDGNDAALLIGREAYRYKALSYLLHNWINSKYNLLIRLEIADFLRNQAQGMDFYLKGVIEKVETMGRAQTKPLDGVLVKIALEKLRERFPNKYVSIRQNGEAKFVIVNDFLKKDE